MPISGSDCAPLRDRPTALNRRHSLQWPAAVSLFFLAATAGCGGSGPKSVRLTYLSPHRDEVREEIGSRFPDWFRQRSQQRLEASRAALDAWLASQRAEDRTAAVAALDRFWSDWNRDDLPELGAADAAWRGDPTADRGTALRDTLQSRLNQLPPVELAFQDVGGGTSQIRRYIEARFRDAPEGIGVDVLFGGGMETFLSFADRGILAPLELPEDALRPIPRTFHGMPLYDAKGRWFGPMLTSFGILYNREVLERLGEPEPRRWEDLGTPGLRGWVSAGDPRMTGSVHMVYEIILQGHGWDDGFRLLLRLGANTHGFIRDSGTLTRTVSTGDVAAAGTLDANALSAVGLDPVGMGFHLPRAEPVTTPEGKQVRRGGTVINPDCVAVLKGAPHLALGRAFIEYTLSPECQKLLILRTGVPGGPRRHPLCRLSVLPQLYDEFPPEQRSIGAANPFRDYDALEYNDKASRARWDALNDFVGAVLVDAHEELAAAWEAVCNPHTPEMQQHLERTLFQPFCTEEELLAYARRIEREGPRCRVEMTNRWGDEARKRYRFVRQEARLYGDMVP